MTKLVYYEHKIELINANSGSALLTAQCVTFVREYLVSREMTGRLTICQKVGVFHQININWCLLHSILYDLHYNNFFAKLRKAYSSAGCYVVPVRRTISGKNLVSLPSGKRTELNVW